jgi:SAM-dependent methyltransferase
VTAPPRADPTLAHALARALQAAGFDAAAHRQVLGAGSAAAQARVADLPLPLAAALRLFVLGEPVEVPTATAALGELGVEGAVALGVVALEGRNLRPAVRIVPHDVLLVASDLPSDEPAPDHVAAAHGPSLTLARLTVRRHVQAALDLGTGNGVQALLLASHADRVVATDVSERALRFTELNAALNGRTNIETRRASFLDPVGGERFGVVVCSPPYVVSPDSDVLYREGAMRGDAVSEHLVRTVPAVLEDGGFATILVSWVARAREPAPLGWAAASGCDVLVLKLREETARESAEYWQDDPAGVERWLRFYEAESIERIGYGAVVLRRRRGASWREAVELPRGPEGAAGEHLWRLFEGNRSPVDPQQVTFAWPPELVREPFQGGVELRLRRGLGFRVRLDPQAAQAAEAAASGAPVPAEALPLVRQLVGLGLLGAVRNP